MQDSMNDYDRVARQMQKALATLIGNMHQPRREINSNSITITKDGALSGIIQMQRAIDYCHGLAESHRNARACASLDNAERR